MGGCGREKGQGLPTRPPPSQVQLDPASCSPCPVGAAPCWALRPPCPPWSRPTGAGVEQMWRGQWDRGWLGRGPQNRKENQHGTRPPLQGLKLRSEPFGLPLLPFLSFRGCRELGEPGRRVSQGHGPRPGSLAHCPIHTGQDGRPTSWPDQSAPATGCGSGSLGRWAVPTRGDREHAVQRREVLPRPGAQGRPLTSLPFQGRGGLAPALLVPDTSAKKRSKRQGRRPPWECEPLGL